MSTSAVNTSLGRLIAADAGWFFSLYPDAGEGGGGFRSSYQPNRAFVAKGAAADPERAAAEAGRRAGSKLRRYCAANRLNRLGTLTYAGSSRFVGKWIPGMSVMPPSERHFSRE
ncbi:hypothetical protein [Arthrobacter sp. KNU40]|uniref:hypothetical protein n=1 Tax=Arthrobacter sp. KNU40 TaxID=3447965 RepID=UPI003F61C246